MKKMASNRLFTIAASTALFLAVDSASAQVAVADLAVSNLQRISAARVGRSVNEYVFTGSLTNNTGEPLRNVVATVSSRNGATVIVEAVLAFGDIGPGESLTEDTFTFRQNRRYRFSPNNLEWRFDYEPAGENLAPQITSSPITVGSTEASYRYQVVAQDPNPGDVLTYSLGTAPAGMSINAATGLIQWSPGNAAQADVDVQVRDPNGLLDRQIYLISVSEGANDQPPSLEELADQQLSTGSTLSLAASASDPEGQTLRFGLDGAPEGFGINSGTGVMRWRPQEEGSYNVTVRVTDPSGQADTTTFTVNVDNLEPNQPPSLAPIAAQMVSSSETWSLQLQGTDPDEVDVLRYALSDAPAGLNINAISGQLYWTPGVDDQGAYTLTATVTDSVGASASQTFALDVTGNNTAPVAVNDAYTVGIRDTLDIPAPGVLANDSDANGDALTAIATSDPLLGTLNSLDEDGGFSYLPPVIPPMEIGLNNQCAESSVEMVGFSPVIADVDADGDIEIVVIATPRGFPVLQVIDAKTCSQESLTSLPRLSPPGILVASSGSPLLVNLDSDPELEVVFSYGGRSSRLDSEVGPRLVAFNLDGTPVWAASDGFSEAIIANNPSSRGLSDPSAVDLNGDGMPELIAGHQEIDRGGIWSYRLIAYNGVDGSVMWESARNLQWEVQRDEGVSVADLDLDGTVELIYGTSVVSHEGATEFILPARILGQDTRAHIISAVANFDNDPYPEIVAFDGDTQYMFEHTGALKWQRETSLLAGGLADQRAIYAGITVAELDDDAFPEYVLFQRFSNTRMGLSAFNHDGSELWSHRDTPLESVYSQSIKNASAFDFDRDGVDELVVRYRPNTETSVQLVILRGENGERVAQYGLGAPGAYNLFYASMPPAIVDVDNDSQAEIVLSLHSGLPTEQLIILEGSAGNPFPPARSVRNQRHYMPTQVNEDASVPPGPTPYWLVPGLNKVNAYPVVPGELDDQNDQFAYIASDGSEDSNEAQVSITLAVANAPQLVSIPVLGASPEFVYSYGALATDADFGETFTWTLVDAPEGMSIDSFGIISWEPGAEDLGSQTVQVVVTDSRGYSDTQRFTIEVQPPAIVPDLLGQSREDAAVALEAEGLVSGNVTESFDLGVPEGQVISQSVPGGDEAGAGTPIDYVVSLGPQPIFVPLLVGTERAAAVAALEALTLDAGSITYANSDSVAKGSVIRQSVAAVTEVAPGTAVDLVISGGPALAFSLSKNLLGPGDSSVYSAQAFSPEGEPMALPGDIRVSLVPSAGNTGTEPRLSGDTITTGVDTRGGWDVRIDSASLGVTLTEDLVVAVNFAPGNAQASYQTFLTQLSEIQTQLSAISDGLASGDTAAVRAAAAQLVVLRDAIDTDDLLLTPAVAAEEDFLFRDFAGIPSSGERDYSRRLETLRNAVRESTAYMALLRQGRARDDNIRMGVVAEKLDRAGQAFAALDGNVNTLQISKGTLHALLSVEFPALVVQLLDTSIEALQNEGLLAAAGPLRDDYRLVSLVNEPLSAEREPVFFSLPSLMGATNAHMTIVKYYYKPILKKVMANTRNLQVANLLSKHLSPSPIYGVGTGASQSFHIFEAGYSFLEAQTYGADPRSNFVMMIGPEFLADLANGISAVGGGMRGVSAAKSRIQSLKAAGKAVAGFGGLIKALSGGVASGLPDQTLSDCVFDNHPACQQLVFSNGFPSVHQKFPFPGPVLFVIYDATTGKISVGNFLFMPKAPEAD